MPCHSAPLILIDAILATSITRILEPHDTPTQSIAAEQLVPRVLAPHKVLVVLLLDTV